jgi:hypothetical protein
VTYLDTGCFVKLWLLGLGSVRAELVMQPLSGLEMVGAV